MFVRVRVLTVRFACLVYDLDRYRPPGCWVKRHGVVFAGHARPVERIARMPPSPTVLDVPLIHGFRVIGELPGFVAVPLSGTYLDCGDALFVASLERRHYPTLVVYVECLHGIVEGRSEGDAFQTAAVGGWSTGDSNLLLL